MRSVCPSPLLSAVLCAVAIPAAAQSTWVNRQLATAPPGLAPAVMAWSPTAQAVWWVGGGGSGIEVWSYDGVQWTLVPASGVVPPNLQLAVYDYHRHRVVGTQGADVWEFDGTAWAKITPAAQPTPQRTGHSLVYDGARREVLLGCGEYWDSAAGLYLSTGDLWAWTGSTWVQRWAGGGGGGNGAVMAFDPDRAVVVIYGGQYSVPYYWTGQQTTFVVGRTVEWDGTAMRPAALGAKRVGHALAYDKLRRKMVAFGGWATCGYACGYNPATTDDFDGTWSYRTPAVSPPLGSYGRMAFDERRQRMVMVTRSSPLGPLDTWEYYNPSPAQVTAFGAGCAGSAGTPSLQLEDNLRPWLGETLGLEVGNLPAGAPAIIAFGASNTAWAGGGVTLPWSLAPLGAAQCALLVSPDATDAVSGAGVTRTWTLPIPDLPALQGVSLHLQAAVADGAANPLGIVLSNGVTALMQAL